jgi:hypothetical protein
MVCGPWLAARVEPPPLSEQESRNAPSRFKSWQGNEYVWPDGVQQPVDIHLIKGRERAEDLWHLAAGEVTAEEFQRENAIAQTATDILYVDFRPKGTVESL